MNWMRSIEFVLIAVVLLLALVAYGRKAKRN